jgi:hypothetical protein
MAKLTACRGSQYVQSSEFIFSFNDTMVDIAGATRTFGSTLADLTAAATFDIINLPPGAQILGGDIVVEVQGVGPTGYTAALGISGNTAIYAAATSLTGAANTRTALLLTSVLGSNNGVNIRMTMAGSAAVATAGKWRITVMWKADGKQNEAQPS